MIWQEIVWVEEDPGALLQLYSQVKCHDYHADAKGHHLENYSVPEAIPDIWDFVSTLGWHNNFNLTSDFVIIYLCRLTLNAMRLINLLTCTLRSMFSRLECPIQIAALLFIKIKHSTYLLCCSLTCIIHFRFQVMKIRAIFYVKLVPLLF